MTERLSAGILLYRRRGDDVEVLLAHPGGPYYARRDAGAWTVPKGEPDHGGESLLTVARREFEEETGHAAPDDEVIGLGSIVQKGGKVVHAWALEGELDPATAHSNTFELTWPPGSDTIATFEEIDRVAWFSLGEARERLTSSQLPFVDRLEAALERG